MSQEFVTLGLTDCIGRLLTRRDVRTNIKLTRKITVPETSKSHQIRCHAGCTVCLAHTARYILAPQSIVFAHASVYTAAAVIWADVAPVAKYALANTVHRVLFEETMILSCEELLRIGFGMLCYKPIRIELHCDWLTCLIIEVI